MDESRTQQVCCPGYDCDILVPQHVIERYISPKMSKKCFKVDFTVSVEENKTGLLLPDNKSQGKYDKTPSQNPLIPTTVIRKGSYVQETNEHTLSTRMPFTQIHAQHFRNAGTLPGKLRSGSYYKETVEDPWLMKENQIENEDVAHVNKPSEGETFSSAQKFLKLSKGGLHKCQNPGCTNKFWVKSIKETNKEHYSNNISSFCNIMCFNKFTRKLEPRSKFEMYKDEVLDLTDIGDGSITGNKDNEITKPSQNCTGYTVATKRNHLEDGKGLGTRDVCKMNVNYNSSFSSPYNDNIGPGLYTLPRTSRSDDNLLLETSSITSRYNNQDDGKIINVSGECDNLNLEDELGTCLENKSVSTECIESQCLPDSPYEDLVKSDEILTNEHHTGKDFHALYDKFPEINTVANETVHSFLKTLGAKSDKDPTLLNVSPNINANTLPDVQDCFEPEAKGGMNQFLLDQKKSRSTKNIRKKLNAADTNVRIFVFDESCGISNKRPSRKMRQGNYKRISFKLLKRSHSTGEINHLSKKAHFGTKFCNSKKPSMSRGVKRLVRNVPCSETINGATLSVHKDRRGNYDGGVVCSEAKDEEGHENIQCETKAANTCNSTIKLHAGNKARPKFVRQKSFEIDSDTNDGELEKGENVSQGELGDNLKTDTKQEADQYVILKEISESKNTNKIKERFDCTKTTTMIPTTVKTKPNLVQSPKTNLLLNKNTEVDKRNDIKIAEAINSNFSSTIFQVEGNKTNNKKRHPGLTIKIQNSSMVDDTDVGAVSPVSLKTNEFLDALSKELSRSPTLHISGIAISRSPGAAPPLHPTNKNTILPSLSRNRSASLAVPLATPQTAPLMHIASNVKVATSCNNSPRSPGTKSLNCSQLSPNARGSGTSTTPSTSPYTTSSHQQPLLFTFPDQSRGMPGATATTHTPDNIETSSKGLNKNSRESASAHALSSVLLIQESCLSSDDFHEALFLDKKSPNRTLSKKKRKSKKKDVFLASLPQI